MSKRIAWLPVAAALVVSPAWSADKIKIGFVTTLSTPAAVIGEDMRNSVELALEHIGHKMGPLEVEVVYADDEFNPQKGKQATERLVKRDNADIVAGYIWSNVLLASASVVLDAGKVLISSNAGPSPLAGEKCHKNFFNVSWQNDQTPMALGEALNRRGVKSLYLLSPNYAAGQDMVAGVERTFKGTIVGKDMTKWPEQIDWSAELSKVRAAKPDAVFVFYPGKHGPAFLKQYKESGLTGKIPLYSVYTIDSIGLPLMQKAQMDGVLGTFMTQFWAPDMGSMENDQNRRFVTDYKKKHGRYPSFYGAQSYDTIFFIKDAVEQAGGKIDDVDALRKAMENTKFPSVRGKFRFGNNHFPIQNFYLREVVKDKEGNWTTKVTETILEDHQDVYAKDCKM